MVIFSSFSVVGEIKIYILPGLLVFWQEKKGFYAAKWVIRVEFGLVLGCGSQLSGKWGSERVKKYFWEGNRLEISGKFKKFG